MRVQRKTLYLLDGKYIVANALNEALGVWWISIGGSNPKDPEKVEKIGYCLLAVPGEDK